MLELRRKHAGVGPFAAFAELHVADQSFEGVLMHVGTELVTGGALGGLDRLAENLQIGISPRSHVITDRIDACDLGPLLVAFEEIHHAGILHLGRWQPDIEIDEAVKLLAQQSLGIRRL